MAAERMQPARGAERSAAEPAVARPPSQKRLRELLRSSPLVPPELRAHWLRVLPHLTAAQRAELARLLAAGVDISTGAGADAGTDAFPGQRG